MATRSCGWMGGVRAVFVVGGGKACAGGGLDPSAATVSIALTVVVFVHVCYYFGLQPTCFALSHTFVTEKLEYN